MHEMARHPAPGLIAGQAAPAGLLSNGSYTVLLTAVGTGVSARRGIALTTGPADRVEDCEGFFLYLREPESRRTWSAGFAPMRTAPARYEARRDAGRIVIEREDERVITRCEVAVDPDADRELRRLTLVNRSDRPRRIEVTSCVEVVLNDPAAHAAHPAFSKLFVQTEWHPAPEALLAHRRPRGHGEPHPWMVHAVRDAADANGGTSCETDRARFRGRGRRADQPLAMDIDGPLSGATGNVLDPVLALRRMVTLAPDASAELTFVLGAADTREEALQLVAVEHDVFARAARREAELPWLIGLTVEETRRAEALAAAMFLGDPGLRAAPEILARAEGGAASLAQLGVPWRRPYALLHGEHPDGMELLPTLLAMRRYWRALGLPVVLVVICTTPAKVAAATRIDSAAGGDSPAGLVILRAADLPAGASDSLDAAARMVVTHRLPRAPVLPWKTS
jgi:hypothetical protein